MVIFEIDLLVICFDMPTFLQNVTSLVVNVRKYLDGILSVVGNQPLRCNKAFISYI